jgi:hypothetical protein
MIETAGLKPRGECVHIGAYVEPAQRDRLVELARSRERSVSAEFRLALTAHLERERQSGPERAAT